ncbi:MAG: LptF/LptG family permease [Alistipes sp.]|nr:LptF/LptG family permease [Alistipes sp.]
MKKIHLLVLKAYLGPLVATFFIVQFVLMMNFVWRYIDELTGKGLGVSTIAELLACATANMIPLGLPLAMLLSAIMAMGNLGENFELLAMKSAGMSLPKILKPLIVLVSFIAIGGFFISNNLVPYANQRMYEILYDIREQRQDMEFQDGMFFNGLPDMSIRVGHQNEKTKLLSDIIIFDTRASNGDMTTTIADSGYIYLSDDKSFLYVTLYSGDTYEHSRNMRWYDTNTLRHHSFETQEGTFPIAKVGGTSESSKKFTESKTRNMIGLQELSDSLQLMIDQSQAATYAPLFKERIFPRDSSILGGDSIRYDKANFAPINFYDSISNLPIRERAKVFAQANTAARMARGAYSFDEQSSKVAITQYYRSENEWHRMLTMPVSILVFFLIGAPLGAIIRKGGLGTPIVISVIFFVFYYIISVSGEKMSSEGTWDALYGMWLPIATLTPIAIYLTRQATNDSSLLDTDWYDVRIRKLIKSIRRRTKALRKKNRVQE